MLYSNCPVFDQKESKFGYFGPEIGVFHFLSVWNVSASFFNFHPTTDHNLHACLFTLHLAISMPEYSIVCVTGFEAN